MNIVIVSGKGGTGKTTIATTLARILNAKYVDLDVEEPNGHIFLNPFIKDSKDSNVLLPKVDNDKCTYCGLCAEKCPFSAIVTVKKTNTFMLFEELCHYCGLCTEICPEKALTEIPKSIGKINSGIYDKKDNINFIEGILNLNEPSGVPLISEITKSLNNDEINILDAPPGASCSVVASLEYADFVILTGEPTPFGVNDLSIVYEIVKDLKKPMGMIINKAMDNSILDDFAINNNIPLLGKIPLKREIAEQYSNGVDLFDTIKEYFTDIENNLKNELKKYEKD